MDSKTEAMLETIHSHVSSAWLAKASCPIAERGDCCERGAHKWPERSLEYHLSAAEKGTERLFQHLAKLLEEQRR